MKLIVKGELNIISESGLKINARILELLMLIEESGSLNNAVKQMGVSYSHAWNTLHKIDCQLGMPLIKKVRGGSGGGLTVLTEQGKALLDKYDILTEEFERFLKEHPIDI